jgi:hypothetical protein
MPILPEVSARHGALIAQLVAQWRRASAIVTPEPDPPQDDEEVVEDTERVVAEILGRLLAHLGRLPLEECRSEMDVDRLVLDAVRAETREDSRQGASRAINMVQALLRISSKRNSEIEES